MQTPLTSEYPLKQVRQLFEFAALQVLQVGKHCEQLLRVLRKYPFWQLLGGTEQLPLELRVIPGLQEVQLLAEIHVLHPLGQTVQIWLVLYVPDGQLDRQ